MSTVIFKFNPAVRDKDLTHSFNHKVYELKGEGEFTAPDADWLSLSRVQVSQYEGQTLVDIPAFELVKQAEESAPAEEEAPGRRARRAQ